MFLEECKYIVKVKTVTRFINEDLEVLSDDSDKEASDESDK